MSLKKWIARAGDKEPGAGLEPQASILAASISSAPSSPPSVLLSVASLSSPATSTLLPFGDGSGKIYGMENFGNTCYCNLVLQCLFYTPAFRQQVLGYPSRDPAVPRERKKTMTGNKPHGFTQAVLKGERARAELTATASSSGLKLKFGGSRRGLLFGKKEVPPLPTVSASEAAPPIPEDAEEGAPQLLPITLVGATPDPRANSDTRKRAALTNGPILNLDHLLSGSYGMKDLLYSSLKDLFECMVEVELDRGVVSPAHVVEVLKRENEMFRLLMHQDAHEFLNFLINLVIETIDGWNKEHGLTTPNWANHLFQGAVTNETKCHCCETVLLRLERLLDVLVDVVAYSSITQCLKNFSAQELLSGNNKFFCDTCQLYQEALKSMRLLELPKVLMLHLKRFKYLEQLQRNTKLFNTVLYPLTLRLQDVLYELYACVVHIGGGPHQGHYVLLVKTENGRWLLFDDELVEQVSDNYVLKFFGPGPGLASAYVLFYKQVTDAQHDHEVLFDGFLEETEVAKKSLSPPAASPAARRTSVAHSIARTATNNSVNTNTDLRKRAASINMGKMLRGQPPKAPISEETPPAPAADGFRKFQFDAHELEQHTPLITPRDHSSSFGLHVDPLMAVTLDENNLIASAGSEGKRGLEAALPAAAAPVVSAPPPADTKKKRNMFGFRKK